jgi:hypothetical protein
MPLGAAVLPLGGRQISFFIILILRPDYVITGIVIRESQPPDELGREREDSLHRFRKVLFLYWSGREV